MSEACLKKPGRALTKAAAFILTAALLAAMSAAFAEEVKSPDGAEPPSVILTTKGAAFSAGVPAKLCYAKASDGTIVTADGAKIVNRSPGRLKICGVTLKAPEGADGLTLLGKTVNSTGALTALSCEPVDGNSEYPLYYSVKDAGIPSGEIRTIDSVFVLKWNSIEDINN